MSQPNKWVAVALASLLLLLLGCTSGSDNDDNSTSFPTATLHPVFAFGDEFASSLSETRAAEATTDAEEEPSPTPRPSPTDAPPLIATVGPSPTPDAAATEENVALEDAIEVPILLYHHISQAEGDPSDSGYEYFVPPDQFEEQMAYLADNDYTAIDLYTLYEALQEPDTADLPPNPVVITFDDGYLDLYENAYPILQEVGFAATFFMITDFLEEEQEGYMTWDMVEEMAAEGMRFETHSRSHADLRGQDSDFLISQLLDSQELLAQHIGYTPRFIAYPFGQYDDNLLQFLEENGFWGGLTAQGGLEVALENSFTWPRLYVPADTDIDAFADLAAEGQSISYQPEVVESTTPSFPLTQTITLSTTQGVITAPVLLVFDEGLHADWTARTSPGVRYDLQDNEAHTGDIALSFNPEEDLGSLFFQVRPNVSTVYSREEIVGVAFWLYTGSDPLEPEDLGLVVTGSDDFPYWSAVDDSIDPEEFEPTFEDARFELGFNRAVTEEIWVQVVLFFDDLSYDTDYRYITGLNFVNNAGVTRPFLIDELVLILRQP